MQKKGHVAVIMFLIVLGGMPASSFATGRPAEASDTRYDSDRQFRMAMEAFENGMYGRAMQIFDDIVCRTGSVKAEGYSVLCAVLSGTRGWQSRLDNFTLTHPSSELSPQLTFAKAGRLFTDGEYAACADLLEDMGADQLRKSQYDLYLFRYAFSLFNTGREELAAEKFREIISRPKSDFTAPSAYSLAYIEYGNSRFADAEEHFSIASGDHRFADMAAYYITECRFMEKDYDYVIASGTELYSTVPEDRKLRLGRIMAESYLIKGDAEKAAEYYDPEDTSGNRAMSRSDRFFAGSVLYAGRDYKGAIENFSAMDDRTDSLGQIANYHLGWAYLQTGDKVSALDAFKDASDRDWDASIRKDAMFNSAKLAFDINSDVAPFKRYIACYPEKENQEIYAYMALAALYGKDWQGAVEAYDNVDDFTPEMARNYAKANYLRARQLIAAGSSRSAAPLLRTVTFYSDKSSFLNQISRYWMAEIAYRNGEYDKSISIDKELYNVSALSSVEEGGLIPYNIAYSYYKLQDYRQAAKWFETYLASTRQTFDKDRQESRKDAATRLADCSFISEKYREAAHKYEQVAATYFDPDDVYPYLQAGIAYGLAGDRKRKINCLEEVKMASSDAEGYSDAMLELGRSYLENGGISEASECFRSVITSVKDSSAVAGALMEQAMLERNSRNTDGALLLYKRVVENMPETEYADNALLAIETICKSEGLADDYMAYINGLGRSSVKTEAEAEEFYFSAAQQLYFDARYDKALDAMRKYIEKYPQGQHLVNARYCEAECLRLSGQYEQACDAYENVIEAGKTDFQSAAMRQFALLSYSLERYNDAYLSYTAILASSGDDEELMKESLVGQMRSAFKARMYDDAIAAASGVIEKDVPEQLKREAEYMRAKSLMSVSRRDESIAAFSKLAENPKDAIGAEARYYIIKDRFERADYKAVEDMVYDFSDSGTAQNRYLAAAFIILGDSFAEQGNIVQAKATFESVRDGYTPESETDDTLDQVRMRLERISQM